jgi:hypothetical protein
MADTGIAFSHHPLSRQLRLRGCSARNYLAALLVFHPKGIWLQGSAAMEAPNVHHSFELFS